MSKLIKKINLYGLTMIAVGGCIGAGIFVTPYQVAEAVPTGITVPEAVPEAVTVTSPQLSVATGIDQLTFAEHSSGSLPTTIGPVGQLENTGFSVSMIVIT